MPVCRQGAARGEGRSSAAHQDTPTNDSAYPAYWIMVTGDLRGGAGVAAAAAAAGVTRCARAGWEEEGSFGEWRDAAHTKRVHRLT